jgi:DNA-binding NarL/FixJ family response regulator
MENTSIKKKSFWERPEGTTGMAFIAIAVVAFFIGANTILPFIIGVLQNTLYTMFLLGCIGAVGVLVANDRFRTAVTTLFQLAMRKLTGFVVEIDPIGILKNYVSTLMKKLGVMDEHIGELRDQILGLKWKIEEKIQERNTFLARAEQYQKQGNSPLDVQLNARSAARDDDMIKSLTGNLQQMEKLHRVLTEMRGKAKFLMEDTKHTVESKEEEYKVIKAAHSAMGAARAVIMGESSQKDMFDQAMQFVADDVAMRIGEMDNFMEISKEILSGVAADRGILNDKGLQMLTEWEKKDSVLLGNTKQVIIENVNKGMAPSLPEKVSVSSKFLD